MAESIPDLKTVARLIATQFPQWSALSIQPIASSGTDHVIYRLGEDRCVRLPRVEWALGQLEKEFRWLPLLAAYLPLQIPLPIARGKPGEGYHWAWSVYAWIAGSDATLVSLSDPNGAAEDLTRFISALHAIDPTGGPAAGAHNFGRGIPLAERDAATVKAIDDVDRLGLVSFTQEQLLAVWNQAVGVPVWNKAPVWIHDDLQSGNLLAESGKLRSVIDFGGLGIGDPACDLMVAWNLLERESRSHFKSCLQLDEHTWARGRGWAMSVALIQLPYYHAINPDLSTIALHTIEQVMLDCD